MTEHPGPRRSAVRLALYALITATIAFACLPFAPDLPGMPPGPAQHIAAFAVLTVLSIWSFPDARLATIFIALAILGGAIEVIQAMPQIGREASLTDWLVDCGSVLAVLLLTAVARWLRRSGDLPDRG